MLKQHEAAVVLVSFSLLKIDEIGRCMSIHPLISGYVGQRPALGRAARGVSRRFWVTSSSTLAATISKEYRLTDCRSRRVLLPHIKSCISPCKDMEFSHWIFRDEPC